MLRVKRQTISFDDATLKVIEDYRKNLAAGRYEGPLCSNCFTYMEGTA